MIPKRNDESPLEGVSFGHPARFDLVPLEQSLAALLRGALPSPCHGCRPTPLFPDYAILVAGNLHEAQATAVTSWAWSQVAATEFRAPLGECVRYVGDAPGSLYGLKPGTRVYCGHRWYERRDVRMLQELFTVGRLVRVER